MEKIDFKWMDRNLSGFIKNIFICSEGEQQSYGVS